MNYRLGLRQLFKAFCLICVVFALFANPFISNVNAKPDKKANKNSSAKKKSTPAALAANPANKSTAVPRSSPAANDQRSAAPTVAATKSSGDQFLSVQSGEPVNISADSLSVNNEARTFTYSGGVIVTQGDMTLNCASLDGTYTAENQIDQLIAKTKVTITKGATITASGDRAIYDAKSRIVTLTDNPQLQEGESTLTADVIKIFLDENRSVAEGQVRMKLIKATTPTPGAAVNVNPVDTPAAGVILSPSPTVSPTPALFIQRLM